MQPVYIVDKIKEHKTTYYLIRLSADATIMSLATKYLAHKVRAHKSPNTVKRAAYSIAYFLNYLSDRNEEIIDIYEKSYEEQHKVFSGFLLYIKRTEHTDKKNKKLPSNYTCNTYLRDVFGLFTYLELEYEQFGKLKVLTDKNFSIVNSAGVRRNIVGKTFRGFLKENQQKGKSVEQDKILTLLEACSNCRDQLLLLLLAETGFRIGELLGVDYTKDIDYKKRTIRVEYREDNENEARAKYAEYRSALISIETFDILLYYLSEYKEYLKKTNYLFVNLAGDTAGQALNVNSVYALLKRLENKTGIKVTPHMIRRYFANERRENGWDLLLIKEVLGHRNIQTTIRYLDEQTEEVMNASEEYYRKNKSIFMVDQLL